MGGFVGAELGGGGGVPITKILRRRPDIRIIKLNLPLMLLTLIKLVLALIKPVLRLGGLLPSIGDVAGRYRSDQAERQHRRPDHIRPRTVIRRLEDQPVGHQRERQGQKADRHRRYDVPRAQRRPPPGRHRRRR